VQVNSADPAQPSASHAALAAPTISDLETAQATRASSEPLAPASPDEADLDEANDVVFALDFEDGESPPYTRHGGVRPAPGPPRTGSQFALPGWVYSPRDANLGVMLKLGGLPYEPGMRLSFLYWMGEWSGEPPAMWLWVYDASGRRPVLVDLPAPTPVSWTRVTVSLDDLRPRKQPDGPGLRRGDRLATLKIATSARAQDVFFVDDIRLSRARPGPDVAPSP
jgi:hypothetical protein